MAKAGRWRFSSETACDGEVWKINQVAEFSRDHRVIISDYRGTGQSSKPSIDYSTAMFCQDAVASMEYLKADDAIVVGHSMGGRVAQLMALDLPSAKCTSSCSHPPAPTIRSPRGCR